MDSSDPQASLPRRSARIRKRKAENEKIAVALKKAGFYSSYRRQNFALPDSIMYYMAKNPPSVNVYQKLIKRCKYFFVKNPILVLSDLSYDYRGWETWIKNASLKKTSRGVHPSSFLKSVDINNTTAKFWITDIISVRPHNLNNNRLVSSITSKIYRCDAETLYLKNQIISFDELLVLGSNIDYLNLDNVTVKNADGTVVALDKLVEVLPKAKYIQYKSPSGISAITSKTFKALLETPHFLTMDHLHLYELPEDFDIASFYAYMKKNKHSCFVLSFSDTLSEAYKNRLEAIIDEIIESDNHEYKIPYISFHGLDEEKDDKLDELASR